jgi:hypothetical protein
VSAAQQPATCQSTTGRYVTHPHCIASTAGAAAAAAAGLVDPAGATTSAALQQVAAGCVCACCHLLQSAASTKASGPGGCGLPSDCSAVAWPRGVGDNHTSSGGGGGNSTHRPAYGGDRTDRVDWAGRVHRDAAHRDYHRGGGHAGCGGYTEAVLRAQREVHGHTQLSGSQRCDPCNAAHIQTHYMCNGFHPQWSAVLSLTDAGIHHFSVH